MTGWEENTIIKMRARLLGKRYMYAPCTPCIIRYSYYHYASSSPQEETDVWSSVLCSAGQLYINVFLA